MWSRCAWVWSRATAFSLAAFEGPQDPLGLVAGIDHDGFARNRVGENGAVALQRADREGFDDRLRRHGWTATTVSTSWRSRDAPLAHTVSGEARFELDGPLLVVGAPVLRGKELAAAPRSEDLPADVAEVDGVAMEIERGDLLARLDLRVPDGRRGEAVGAEPLLELAGDEPVPPAQAVPAAGDAAAEDEVVESRRKLRVHWKPNLSAPRCRRAGEAPFEPRDAP